MIENIKKTAAFLKQIGNVNVGSDFSFINSAGSEESKSPLKRSEDPWKGLFEGVGDIGKSQKTLDDLVEKMERRKEQVKAQLLEIEQQIDQAFKDYKNYPYYLHSILVHDGDAESGHYYAFIFDRAGNKWWRMNDF